MPQVDLSKDEIETLIYWNQCLDPNSGNIGDDDYLPFAELTRKLQVSIGTRTDITDSHIAELKQIKETG